jgi:hypothetical protein
MAAAEAGGGAPIALNAANEVAVAAFLAGRIRFTAISPVIARFWHNMRGPIRATSRRSWRWMRDARGIGRGENPGIGTLMPPAAPRPAAIVRLEDGIERNPDISARIHRRHRRAGGGARVRAFLGREPPGHQGPALLDRLRAAVVAPHGRRWHRVLDLRHPARRLRQDARRARGQRGARGSAAQLQPASRRRGASPCWSPGRRSISCLPSRPTG